MTEVEKSEWFPKFKAKYLASSKKEKKLLLDSLEQTLGIHRKSAIRLLKKKSPGRKPQKKRGRKSRYDQKEFVKALRYVWKQTRYMNSRNLHSAIPEWLDSVRSHYGEELSHEVVEKLLAISPRTIDRVLQSYKAAFRKKGGDPSQAACSKLRFLSREQSGTSLSQALWKLIPLLIVETR